MPFGSNILSPTHLLLVLLVVALLFGTKELPELGRGMGSAMREFRDGLSGRSVAAAPLEASTAPSDGAHDPVVTGVERP